jgi:hypothetical protein
MSMLQVVNHNTQPLFGRYDGTDYEFAPGKPVELTAEAAQHIFAFGLTDKSQALNMLGLLPPGRSTFQDALATLAKVSFLEGKTVYEDESPTRESESKETGVHPHATGAGGESGARAAEARAPANPRGRG